MKRILLAVLAFCITALTFAGCSNIASQNALVNFFEYEGVQSISDIQEIKLPKKYSKLCSSYKFTYSSDDYYVKAYISIPLDCSSENKKSCLLYNRGGNSRIGLLSDTDTAQICAEINRVVIASQYRGADSGTGKDEFGGADLNDLIKLIDLCESTFDFTDIKDFCVAGVSRGGMMTYMLARSDTRVSRIVAVSAVSDLKKAYNDREDMRELLKSSIGGSPELLPSEYENRSAICWAEEITTPVLMIHSKYDEQVSYSQAESLKAEFDKNRLACTLITHDDKTHGMHKEDITTIKNWLSE